MLFPPLENTFLPLHVAGSFSSVAFGFTAISSERLSLTSLCPYLNDSLIISF